MSSRKPSQKRPSITSQQIVFAVFGLLIIFSMIVASLMGY